MEKQIKNVFLYIVALLHYVTVDDKMVCVLESSQMGLHEMSEFKIILELKKGDRGTNKLKKRKKIAILPRSSCAHILKCEPSYGQWESIHLQ